MTQTDKLTDTLMAEVEALQPDLVVVGSEQLASTQAVRAGMHPQALGQAGPATSMALALARVMTDVPLLVVKPNSVGELFNTPEQVGQATPIRVVLEVQTAAAPMLTWLGRRMSGAKDRLWLVRPFGLERGTHREQSTTTRMLASFVNDALSLGFTPYNCRKVAIEGGPGELGEVAVGERADILGIMAPTAKVTPTHILDLLRTARTNVLVWRISGRQDRMAGGGY